MIINTRTATGDSSSLCFKWLHMLVLIWSQLRMLTVIIFFSKSGTPENNGCFHGGRKIVRCLLLLQIRLVWHRDTALEQVMRSESMRHLLHLRRLLLQCAVTLRDVSDHHFWLFVNFDFLPAPRSVIRLPKLLW